MGTPPRTVPRMIPRVRMLTELSLLEGSEVLVGAGGAGEDVIGGGEDV